MQAQRLPLWQGTAQATTQQPTSKQHVNGAVLQLRDAVSHDHRNHFARQARQLAGLGGDCHIKAWRDPAEEGSVR